MFFLLHKQRTIKMKPLTTKMIKQITQKWDKQQLKQIPKSTNAYFIRIYLKQKKQKNKNKNKKKKKQMETKSLTKVLIKLQNKAYFFNLIWSLEVWWAGLSASEVVILSLSLETPSTGMTIEAKSCWKPLEVTSASGTATTLSKDAS